MAATVRKPAKAARRRPVFPVDRFMSNGSGLPRRTPRRNLEAGAARRWRDLIVRCSAHGRVKPITAAIPRNSQSPQ